MEITNEQQDDTSLLTKADLVSATWAISEVFNYMLEGYNKEEYGEMTKEQAEHTLNSLRTAFIKFDSILQSTTGETDESEIQENS
tara:strand:- start:2708 stop:2962 length:255 start_codon:yes stop_codon:yes gene_type:complete